MVQPTQNCDFWQLQKHSVTHNRNSLRKTIVEPHQLVAKWFIFFHILNGLFTQIKWSFFQAPSWGDFNLKAGCFHAYVVIFGR